MSFGASVHLPALLGIEGVRVVALADGGSGRAEQLAAALDPPARAFADGRVMAQQAAIDLIIAATPPAAQAGVVLDSLSAGKAVFCEKPFGASLEEAEAMTAAAEASELANATGFQFRYDPGIARLIEAVETDTVGPVHRIEVDWLTSGGRAADRPWSWRHDDAQGGGVLPEFCSHVLDYLMLLARGPVTDVQMRTQTVIESRQQDDGKTRPVTAPDRVEMLVELGAATAQVAVSNVEPVAFGHRIVVHGSRGRLTFHHRPPFRPEDLSLQHETDEGVRDLPCAPYAEADGDSRIVATRALLTELITRLRGGRAKRLPDFRAGLAVRRAMAKAVMSAAA